MTGARGWRSGLRIGPLTLYSFVPFNANSGESERLKALEFTALQDALYRQKNRMVIFAVEINFFTYRGLTHAWTMAIPVWYRFSAFRFAPSGAWVDPAGIRGVPQPAS